MNALAFVALASACAPLVHPATAQAVVAVESAFNPHAIGVVGGHLERQPRSRAEALATTRALQASGLNFSVGFAQINVHNLPRLGLTVDSAFDPCRNLSAMQTVLTDCFDRASGRGTPPQHSLRRAMSCYYSGDFATGFRDGYVDRVVRAARLSATRPPTLRQTKETP